MRNAFTSAIDSTKNESLRHPVTIESESINDFFERSRMSRPLLLFIAVIDEVVSALTPPLQNAHDGARCLPRPGVVCAKLTGANATHPCMQQPMMNTIMLDTDNLFMLAENWMRARGRGKKRGRGERWEEILSKNKCWYLSTLNTFPHHLTLSSSSFPFLPFFISNLVSKINNVRPTRGLGQPPQSNVGT